MSISWRLHRLPSIWFMLCFPTLIAHQCRGSPLENTLSDRTWWHSESFWDHHSTPTWPRQMLWGLLLRVQPSIPNGRSSSWSWLQDQRLWLGSNRFQIHLLCENKVKNKNLSIELQDWCVGYIVSRENSTWLSISFRLLDENSESTEVKQLSQKQTIL